MRTAEERRAYKRAWYLAHQVECIARARAWYRDNTERAKAVQAAWAAAHPEKIAELKAKHADAKRARDRNYGRVHAVAIRERATARNRMVRPDRKTIYRKRATTAAGRHTKAEWLSVHESYHGLCVYCLAPTRSRDHIVPLSRGGSNDIENIVPACPSCNSQKHRMPLLVWLAVRRGALEKVA